jgi:5-methylcytosine-specific restriction endonuclease McrA
MIASTQPVLSKRFLSRCDSLYTSQLNRSKEKKSKTGRITRRGYVLLFDAKSFRQWLLAQFGGNENGVIRCCYCPQFLTAFLCAVDHQVPLSRGGLPDLGNLDVICPECNFTKGRMTKPEFEYFISKLREMSAHFGNSEAERDITSRLQKAVQLAASVRRTMAQKAQQAVTVPSTDEDW